MCKFVAGSGRLPAHIINATQPLRYRTNTHTHRSPTCMHTDAITLTPSTRMQAHMLDSRVIWPIVSGNVPERDVEYRSLQAHIINATQPLTYRTNTHAPQPHVHPHCRGNTDTKHAHANSHVMQRRQVAYH